MTTDADRQDRRDHAEQTRRDNDIEHRVNAWADSRRIGSGDYLSSDEYQQWRDRRQSPEVAMLRASADALDKITAAVQSQETAEWAIAEVARMRPIVDAVTVWRDAELLGDDAGDLLRVLRDVHDRSRGLGIGQVTT